MTSQLMRYAIAAVRIWTDLYTWGLPPAVGEARRSEIESDLWEFQRDCDAHRPVNPAAHILIRALLGVPDDLYWRAAHAAGKGRVLRAAGSLIAALLLFATLWVLDLMRTRKLPLPLDPPRSGVSLTPTSLQPSSKLDR